MILHMDFLLKAIICKYGTALGNIKSLILALYVFVEEYTQPDINKSIPMATVTHYFQLQREPLCVILISDRHVDGNIGSIQINCVLVSAICICINLKTVVS